MNFRIMGLFGAKVRFSAENGRSSRIFARTPTVTGIAPRTNPHRRPARGFRAAGYSSQNSGRTPAARPRKEPAPCHGLRIRPAQGVRQLRVCAARCGRRLRRRPGRGGGFRACSRTPRRHRMQPMVRQPVSEDPARRTAGAEKTVVGARSRPQHSKQARRQPSSKTALCATSGRLPMRSATSRHTAGIQAPRPYRRP